MTESKSNLKVIASSKIEVDLEICTNCGSCVRECPFRLYNIKNEVLTLQQAADILCMECGHCVGVCPVKAISLKNFPVEQVVEISEEYKLPTYNSFLNLVMARRSVRQFKKDPIPEDLWKKLLEVGRYSPTGHNDQMVQFTIVRDKERLKQFSDAITKGFLELAKIYKDKPRYKEVLEKLPKNTRELTSNILKNLVIPGLPIMMKGIERGEDFWRWHGEVMIIHASKKATTLVEDCTLAAGNIMLAAHLLGLGTCSLGIATAAINILKEVRELINIPRKQVVAYSLGIGFPRVKYFRVPPRQPAKVTWL